MGKSPYRNSNCFCVRVRGKNWQVRGKKGPYERAIFKIQNTGHDPYSCPAFFQTHNILGQGYTKYLYLFFIEVHNAQDASMYRRMGLFYARYVNFKISYLFYNLAHYFNAFSTSTVLTVHHLLILFWNLIHGLHTWTKSYSMNCLIILWLILFFFLISVQKIFCF